MRQLSGKIQITKQQSMLITDINQLVLGGAPSKPRLSGADLKNMETIENAFLLIENGKFSDFGSMDSLDFKALSANQNHLTFSAKNKLVLPGFVDAHTHIVFAGTREKEFTKRLSGISYQKIAAEGGGILFSVKNLRYASEEQLFEQAEARLKEMISTGTVAVEIKSGYGLSFEDEVKMLRVIQLLKKKSPLTIKATLLAAHAIPPEFTENRQGYVDLINEKLIPHVAKNDLAEAVDVFCETGYFTENETDSILKTAIEFGLKTKVHAHQFNRSGGVRVGVQNQSLSVDHLECMNEEDYALLSNSSTIPMLLPGAAFFLDLPSPPARGMIEAGLPVAISSDYNPGSSPSGNMLTMIALACIRFKMTPAEALNAATQNSAAAIGLENSHGSISKNKEAHFIITKPLQNHEQIPYFFGQNVVESTFVNGIKA